MNIKALLGDGLKNQPPSERLTTRHGKLEPEPAEKIAADKIADRHFLSDTHRI